MRLGCTAAGPSLLSGMTHQIPLCQTLCRLADSITPSHRGVRSSGCCSLLPLLLAAGMSHFACILLVCCLLQAASVGSMRGGDISGRLAAARKFLQLSNELIRLAHALSGAAVAAVAGHGDLCMLTAGQSY